MDGMLHLAGDAAGNPAISSLLGILYAEDFDDPPQPVAPAAEAAEAPAPPPLTQADIDAACDQAVATAKESWESEASSQRTLALAAIKSALAEADQSARAVALAAAEATVQIILAALVGALPKLCHEHGPQEARALLDRILPLLRAEPKIAIRVHADLVPALRQDVLDLQADFAGTITVAPAPIERGDVKITWENGSLVRDTRQILQAMQEALNQLGLLTTVETAPKRSKVYAE